MSSIKSLIIGTVTVFFNPTSGVVGPYFLLISGLWAHFGIETPNLPRTDINPRQLSLFSSASSTNEGAQPQTFLKSQGCQMGAFGPINPGKLKAGTQQWRLGSDAFLFNLGDF